MTDLLELIGPPAVAPADPTPLFTQQLWDRLEREFDGATSVGAESLATVVPLTGEETHVSALSRRQHRARVLAAVAAVAAAAVAIAAVVTSAPGGDGGQRLRTVTPTPSPTTPDPGRTPHGAPDTGVVPLWPNGAGAGTPGGANGPSYGLVAPRPATTRGPLSVSPPDGGFSWPGTIAYVARGAGASRLYVVSGSGATPRLLPTAGVPLNPAWSPDHKTIVYAVDTGSGHPSAGTTLRLISADGTNDRQISACGQVTDQATSASQECVFDQPAWSPDGKWIAVTKYTTGPTQSMCYDPDAISVTVNGANVCDIWLMHPDGSDAHKLVGGFGARWSPDGRSIAYSAVPPTYGSAVYGKVCILRVGTTQKPSCPWPWIGDHVAWSRDGRRVAFDYTYTDRQGNQGTGLDVCTVSSGCQVLVPVSSGSSGLTQAAYPVWAPDGRSVVYSYADGSSNLGNSVLMQISLSGHHATRVLLNDGGNDWMAAL
jgi:Tol biopolymer transport system component